LERSVFLSEAPKSVLKKAYEDLKNLRDIRTKIISEAVKKENLEF
jgi:hypothetical protein